MGLFDFLFSPSDALKSNRHPYVDLGLSVYWATMNVGAHFDYEYGDSFRWGEIRQAKEDEPYKFLRRGSSYHLSRYLTEPSNGVHIDYQTTLLPQDDAAHQRMGGIGVCLRWMRWKNCVKNAIGRHCLSIVLSVPIVLVPATAILSCCRRSIYGHRRCSRTTCLPIASYF